MNSIFLGSKFQALNPADAKPLSGGKVYTYESQTNTLKPTFTTENGTTANTNPVILDANGQADIYLSGTYKIVLTDKNDVIIDTVDPLSSEAQINDGFSSEISINQIDSDTFEVDGDRTDSFEIDRVVRILQSGTYIYGIISASVFDSGKTNVTVDIESGSISVNAESVALSVISKESLGGLTVKDLVEYGVFIEEIQTDDGASKVGTDSGDNVQQELNKRPKQKDKVTLSRRTESDKFSVIPKPAGFNYDYPFDVLTDGINYWTNFNWGLVKNSISGATYYVDYENGDDGNSGATPEQALKTMVTAYAKSDIGKMLLMPGKHRAPSIKTSPSDKEIIIEAYDPDDKPEVIVVDNAYTWSKTSGRTNVYQCTPSQAVANIQIDEGVTGDHGVGKKLVLTSDVADCDATPGSYFYDGSTYFVHTANSRAADDNVLVLLNRYNWNFDGGKVFIENVEFKGGISGAFTIFGDGQLYNIGCSFLYSPSVAAGSLVSTTTRFCYSKWALIGGGDQDGANYKWDGVNADGRFLEENCICVGSGAGLTAQNDQGSTAHDGIIGVRVGGFYAFNASQGIGDITVGTQTFNVGCFAGFCYGTNSTFNIGIVAFQGCEMWLYDCKTQATRWSLSAYTDATMYVIGGGQYDKPSRDDGGSIKTIDDSTRDAFTGSIGDYYVARDLYVARDAFVTGNQSVTGNLKLTGQFQFGAGVAGSTLGNVVGKKEVYNSNGSFAGVMALYDTIS